MSVKLLKPRQEAASCCLGPSVSATHVTHVSFGRGGRVHTSVHMYMCFREMCSLALYSRQIHVFKMGVFQACGHRESRVVALDM